MFPEHREGSVSLRQCGASAPDDDWRPGRSIAERRPGLPRAVVADCEDQHPDSEGRPGTDCSEVRLQHLEESGDTVIWLWLLRRNLKYAPHQERTMSPESIASVVSRKHTIEPRRQRSPVPTSGSWSKTTLTTVGTNLLTSARHLDQNRAPWDHSRGAAFKGPQSHQTVQRCALRGVASSTKDESRRACLFVPEGRLILAQRFIAGCLETITS